MVGVWECFLGDTETFLSHMWLGTLELPCRPAQPHLFNYGEGTSTPRTCPVGPAPWPTSPAERGPKPTQRTTTKVRSIAAPPSRNPRDAGSDDLPFFLDLKPAISPALTAWSFDAKCNNAAARGALCSSSLPLSMAAVLRDQPSEATGCTAQVFEQSPLSSKSIRGSVGLRIHEAALGCPLLCAD